MATPTQRPRVGSIKIHCRAQKYLETTFRSQLNAQSFLGYKVFCRALKICGYTNGRDRDRNSLILIALCAK
jgi:hypothetical protein